MKRLTVLLLALAAIPLALLVSGPVTAQAPPAAAAPTPPGPSRGTAVFNMVRVMREYQKWAYFATEMSKDRMEKSGVIAKKQNELIDLQNKFKVEVTSAKRDEMSQQMIVLQRQIEDLQKQARKEVDEKSIAHLRVLFGELRKVVEAVAETNGFALVLAYPDVVTPEEMNSPSYFEMKITSPAAMPFYVSPNIDITSVVIQTLNKNFPAPGPVAGASPVTPAGGTAPAPVAPRP